MKPRPELLQKIVDCINEGAGRTPKVCAGKFGVNPATFDKWMRLGANPECEDAAIARFYMDVQAASSEQQLVLIDAISKHTASDWKAADRLLKIMNPDMVEGRNVTVSGAIEQNTNHRLSLDAGDLGSLISLFSQFVRPESLEESFIEGEIVEDGPLEVESGE